MSHFSLLQLFNTEKVGKYVVKLVTLQNFYRYLSFSLGCNKVTTYY